MVNGFLRVSVKTILSPNYALGDTLDDDTPDCDNGINDNNDDIMIMMIRQWWYYIQRIL